MNVDEIFDLKLHLPAYPHNPHFKLIIESFKTNKLNNCYSLISGEQKRKEIITALPPTTPTSHQIESTSTPGMYMVPVRGYDNFLAVSKFAEYLDSVSGALQDTEYCMKRAKIMAKHSRQIELEQQIQEHPEDEEDSDSLVIDGVDSY